MTPTSDRAHNGCNTFWSAAASEARRRTPYNPQRILLVVLPGCAPSDPARKSSVLNLQFAILLVALISIALVLPTRIFAADSDNHSAPIAQAATALRPV